MSKNHDRDFGAQALVLLFASLLAIFLSIAQNNDEIAIRSMEQANYPAWSCPQDHLNSEGAGHSTPINIFSY
jgi:hypothetical protein